MKRAVFYILALSLLLAFPSAAGTCSDKYDGSEVFTDKSFSELKSGVKPKQIKAVKDPLLRQIAEQLYKNEYNTDYRVQKYSAIISPTATGKNLKIGNGFSRYENITGIFLPEGEATVFVGDTHGQQISLLMPNLMRQPTPGHKPTEDPNGWGLKCKSVLLEEGINTISVPYDCNAYISYFVDDPSSAPAVTVHFPFGQVNGFFDSEKDNDEDWNRLLDNAVSPIMDARGKYIQVAYPVEYFKQYAYGRGKELIDNYDDMLFRQYSFMGLAKYDKMPGNRIFARVNFNYYMFRDGDGVAYLGNPSTMRMVAEPSVVIKGDPCWGFSHEVGHVLQMRPQLTWGGMTEVSNNLYSLCTTTGLGNPSRIQEQNNYAKARENIIGKDISYLQDDDVFDRLVPFWQLHLYFSRNGYPDFYADLMEHFRNTPDAGRRNNSIRNQFEFIKAACDTGKTDLTDFFEKWGFFYVGNIELNDYANYSYKITQQQVDDTKAYISSKNYPKPVIDITTIEDTEN